MFSRRFELILRFLHLNDLQIQPQRGQPGFNKLYKIRSLLELILPAFKDNYTPAQFLSIGESMIAFKGHLSFLQYLPKKPHKWGMKAWVLADARCWQMLVGAADAWVLADAELEAVYWEGGETCGERAFAQSSNGAG